MEGVLLVPPDRGTIIGRAVWKPRYVVIGTPQRDLPNPASSAPYNLSSSSKLNTGRTASPRSPSSFGQDPICMSIYKFKDDLEPTQQFALTSITDCSVQPVAHRKQGPHLPTLVVGISPDPATDKLRKRRSSRTAGLSTTKDAHPSSLWFRTLPEDHTHSLQEWARCIQSMIQSHALMVSPISPNAPSFINPFSSMRPSSGNPGSRSTIQHKPSTNTYSSRERPVTFSSESPGLRSKKSDLSSHAGSANYGGFTITTGHFCAPGPDNLPSPATTIGEYTGDFIEGWTAAQGRSSTVSSPIRGRDSLSSQPQIPVHPPPVNASSPPGPRETILDRAFQMNVIPGSDTQYPGEEKLTSLARFDALMREAEEKRLKREAEEKRLKREAEEKRLKREAEEKTTAESNGLKSAWDLDESSDEEGYEDDPPSHDFDLEEEEEEVVIGLNAQRALEFIANRHGGPNVRSAPPYTRSTISYHPDTLRALGGGDSRRPHTGYAKHRPTISQRTNSQPQLPREAQHSPASTVRPGDDANRQSASSAKRLSLNDFTKRLSSTSSLLLVQTNNSGGSSQRSSEIETQSGPVPRSALNPRNGPPPLGPKLNRDEQDWENLRKCGWRGSVGVFGAGEGGFL